MTNAFEQPEFNDVSHMKRFIDMMDRREIVKLIGTDEGIYVRFGSGHGKSNHTNDGHLSYLIK